MPVGEGVGRKPPHYPETTTVQALAPPVVSLPYLELHENTTYRTMWFGRALALIKVAVWQEALRIGGGAKCET
jgi:hypothetical protein